MRQRLLVLGGAFAVAGAAGACASVSSEPNAVVALGFDTSTVAVLVGDTLRDTLGLIVPLRAVVFNAAGDTVRDLAAPPSYVFAPTDTGVVRLAGDLVIGARLRATPARVYATVGGLQSLPKSIDVVRLPSALQPLALADSALYFAGATAAARTGSTGGAQLRVTADSVAGSPAAVRRVVVRFVVERAAPRVADSVVLLDERSLTTTLTPVSPLDTSDAQGNAGRRVLVYVRPGAAGRDSVVLRATLAYPAAYRGASAAARDTVRVVVPVVPRASS